MVAKRPPLSKPKPALRGIGPVAAVVERSLENPSTSLADPDDWMFDVFGGEAAGSGVRVSRESALKYAPWWRGINLIARDVGKLPLLVYEEGEQGGKTIARTHPAYQLLYRRPNQYMTSTTFRTTLTAHALNGGNGYAYIERDGAGRPRALLPLDPDFTYPVRYKEKLYYRTRDSKDPQSNEHTLTASDVLHIHGLGYDGLVGYSVFKKAKESIGRGIGARAFASNFFRNNARPNLALQMPDSARGMSPENRKELRADFERMASGLENAHRPLLLPPGAVLQPFSINAKESMLLDGEEFSIRDIANWLCVPPHKLGDMSRTAYNSIEQENLSYLTDGLDIWLVLWEEECSEKLLSEKEKQTESHSIKFRRHDLQMIDTATRAAFYKSGIESGYLSRDEAREAFDLNPIPDGDGEKFLVPLNMTTIGDEPKVPGGDVDALLKIVDSVKAGLPVDTGKVMLQTTFPKMTLKQINALLKPLEDVQEAEEEQQPQEPLPPPPVDGQNEPIPPENEPLDGTKNDPAERAKSPVNALSLAVADVITRAVRRIGHQAARAAKKPATFNDWTERIGAEHIEAVQKMVEPVEAMAATCGTPAREPLAPWILGACRSGWLTVAGTVRGKELEKASMGAVDGMAKRLAGLAMEEVFAGGTGAAA